MNQRKRQTFRQKIRLTSLLVLSVISLAVASVSIPQNASAHHAGDCSDVYTPLPSSINEGVNRNKSTYVRVMNETGVPWEMLAAIHYRETSFSRTNPSNGQGIFQFVNGAGGPYPPGPVSDQEFYRQLKFMANKVQDDYVWRGTAPREKRRLNANETNITIIKDTLFSYNGRASVYADQAAHFGYNRTNQPYEGSPYVMNRFDCQRARMGIITRDYGSLDGRDTRYGAFTLFARLRGESYWQSLQSRYSGATAGSASYVDQNKSKGKNTTTMIGGERAYMVVRVLNAGTHTWQRSNTLLGTDGPRDRQSAFRDGWVSANRATYMNEASVAPGQTATFEFWYKAPTKTGKYSERFSVVLEGQGWAPYFGFHLNTTVENKRYTGQTVDAMSHTDTNRNKSMSTTSMEPHSRAYMTLRVRNTGNVTWKQANTRLATDNPRDRQSAFKDNTWLTNNRIARMDQETVAPGQLATFRFWYKAPQNGGTYQERFSVVLDGESWVPYFGFHLNTNVKHYPHHSQILSSGSYTNTTLSNGKSTLTMAPGDRAYVVVNVKNIGALPWNQSNTRLATDVPRDRNSAFRDDTWLTNNRVARMDQTVVQPGQTATFRFWYKAPQQKGTYQESFGVVIDGVSWTPYAGFHLNTNVQ